MKRDLSEVLLYSGMATKKGEGDLRKIKIGPSGQAIGEDEAMEEQERIKRKRIQRALKLMEQSGGAVTFDEVSKALKKESGAAITEKEFRNFMRGR